MDINAWIQIAIAVIAIAALVVNWRASAKTIKQSNRDTAASIRESDRSTKLQRVIEASVELQMTSGRIRAEILPFWKDSETRRRYAQVPQEVSVHRAMEDLFVLHRLLLVHVETANRAQVEARALTESATLMVAATKSLYYALIPEARPDRCAYRLLIETISEFTDETNTMLALKTAEAAYRDERLECKVEGYSNKINAFLDHSEKLFAASLSAYARTE